MYGFDDIYKRSAFPFRLIRPSAMRTGRPQDSTLKRRTRLCAFRHSYSKLPLRRGRGVVVVGKEVISSIAKDIKLNDEELEAIHEHIYEEYIEALCAIAIGTHPWIAFVVGPSMCVVRLSSMCRG